MLFYAVGIIVVGIVMTKRGDAFIQKARQCTDEEEKAALMALGNRTHRWGQILLWVGAVLALGGLIFLGALMSSS